MYQSQQYHTSNYRGNQQGHDSYLRADSQSPSTYGTQNVQSQYRGYQKPFQPTGPVNSVYGQNANTGFSQTNTGYSSFGASQGTQNYHTANYRGDQQGHDSYLREDSRQPAQSQFGVVSNLNQTSFTPSFGTFGTSSFNNAGVSSYNQNQNQFVSPESYHTASYRGNQQGHDSYLREDSRQPAQAQFGIGASGTSYGNVGTSNFSSVNQNIGASSFGNTSLLAGGNFGSSLGSQFGSSNLGTYGASNLGTSSFGASNISSQGQNQFATPESYHTANYRGNQQGHDSYLREDSRQPAQSQYGVGMTSGSFGSNTSNRY